MDAGSTPASSNEELMLNYPKPHEDDTRWYVDAHPNRSRMRILEVVFLDVSYETAVVEVDRIWLDQGQEWHDTSTGQTFETPWYRLPESLQEAKKLLIHLKFTGALM